MFPHRAGSCSCTNNTIRCNAPIRASGERAVDYGSECARVCGTAHSNNNVIIPCRRSAAVCGAGRRVFIIFAGKRRRPIVYLRRRLRERPGRAAAFTLVTLYTTITFVRGTTGGGMFVKRPLCPDGPSTTRTRRGRHYFRLSAVVDATCRLLHCVRLWWLFENFRFFRYSVRLWPKMTTDWKYEVNDLVW